MAQQLWAPWRLSYVTGKKSEQCVFCAKTELEDSESLIIARGDHAYVVMNLYPYNSGHLLIVPFRHVAELEDLTDDESRECQQLLTKSIRVLRTSITPEGFNVGLNLGAAAGAGIKAHLHWHIVPRWAGDTNFMPVVADINVMPQHLAHTHEQLQSAWQQHDTDEGSS